MPRFIVLVRVLFWTSLALAFLMAVLPNPVPVQVNDKFQHFAAFVVLAALAILSYPRAPLAKIAVLLALFGALIEVMQAIPTFHRDAELADWLVDIGAIVAVIVLVAIQRVGGRPAGQGRT